jgi:lipid II:glycine glycyltransferase (peptidoglycan interpeptide bridge formation enzyme)
MENCPYPGANKLLQLEIMKWLKANGANRYVMGGNRLGDIAGTKYEGIQKFKLRFGAEIEKGTHFYTKVTWRYSLYSKLLKAYLILRNIKQNTKGLNYRYG